MKVAVFGATGRTGQEVVRQALDAGHQVTAVVRDPAGLRIDHPALQVVTTADVTRPETFQAALAGQDAVVSALGSRTRRSGGIATAATRAILRASAAAGVARVEVLSAMPVGPMPAGESAARRLILVPLLRRFLRDAYADLAAMEDEVRHSAAEWTIVRPPRLTLGPRTGDYRVVVGGNVPAARSISRADLAHAMLALLDDPAAVKQAVGVAG
ncbi:NADH-flavin reductase [Sphaerisporangium rufum]|uniref:NADH-flavin reductase n=1 Tax=Sphaerisporangium rufum TaxID=1381558 RepID=A0A919V421_9ACTN|nr:NAD(P)H-binding protein [Sphaerisporangium rufum]GII80713.1 NADH-flavin reductase [Sphaerisporangium rufum]